CVLGHAGWREGLGRAVAIAREDSAITHSYVVGAKHMTLTSSGVLLPDDAAVEEIREALRRAEESADDTVLSNARMTLGTVLMHRESTADHDRGLELLAQVREMCLSQRYFLANLPFINAYIARESARRGDRDGAIPAMREAVDDLFNMRELGTIIPVVGLLVETLL